MGVSNYTDLQAAIAAWMNRQDLVQNIPDFIILAEAEFNRVLRDTRMVTSVQVAYSQGVRTVPLQTDCLAVNYAQNSSGQPLEQIDIAQLNRLRTNRLRLPGVPLYFAVNGRTVELCPTPSAAGQLEIDYFQAIPPLSSAANGVNWLLTFSPDLYLNTSVKYAKMFLQDYDPAKAFGNEVASGTEQLGKLAADLTLQTGRIAGYSLTSPSDIGAAPAGGVTGG